MLAACGGKRAGQRPPLDGAAPAPAVVVPAHAGPGRLVLRLERLHAGGPLVFGVPLPDRAVAADGAGLRLLDDRDAPLPGAAIVPILYTWGADGTRTGLRAVRVVLPGDALPAEVGARRDLVLTWPAPGRGGSSPAATFAALARAPRDATVPVEVRADVVDREIVRQAGALRLVERNRGSRVLHPAREARVLVRFPDGYLAGTGLFGALPTRAELARDPRFAGVTFFSTAIAAASRAVVFDQPWAASAGVVPDLVKEYEAWLYDRCATFLVAAAHAGDATIQRQGLRACAFYADRITPVGLCDLKLDDKGEPFDDKYSHLRGLYLAYALTGDDRARAAAVAIADMWERDEGSARPYRQGRLPGKTRLWTERQLAGALEAGVYGYLLTGERRHLDAARELVATAHRHITAPDAAAVEAVVGWPLPPQDCLVHAKEQHEGFGGGEPWCSSWMSAMLVEPLARYRELTGDARADEIVLRLARFLRDRGVVYFKGDPQGDAFLAPSVCYDARDGEGVRRVSPAYGAGLRADGTRFLHSEWDDFEHCADVSAITAGALAALARRGGADAPGPAPFRGERESLLALHHELLHCAKVTFAYYQRDLRDPRRWGPKQLADSHGQQVFLEQQKIGWPPFDVSPLRKYGWWFNGSVEALRVAADAGVDLRQLRPGAIQCRR